MPNSNEVHPSRENLELSFTESIRPNCDVLLFPRSSWPYLQNDQQCEFHQFFLLPHFVSSLKCLMWCWLEMVAGKADEVGTQRRARSFRKTELGQRTEDGGLRTAGWRRSIACSVGRVKLRLCTDDGGRCRAACRREIEMVVEFRCELQLALFKHVDLGRAFSHQCHHRSTLRFSVAFCIPTQGENASAGVITEPHARQSQVRQPQAWRKRSQVKEHVQTSLSPPMASPLTGLPL